MCYKTNNVVTIKGIAPMRQSVIGFDNSITVWTGFGCSPDSPDCKLFCYQLGGWEAL